MSFEHSLVVLLILINRVQFWSWLIGDVHIIIHVVRLIKRSTDVIFLACTVHLWHICFHSHTMHSPHSNMQDSCARGAKSTSAISKSLWSETCHTDAVYDPRSHGATNLSIKLMCFLFAVKEGPHRHLTWSEFPDWSSHWQFIFLWGFLVHVKRIFLGLSEIRPSQ